MIEAQVCLRSWGVIFCTLAFAQPDAGQPLEPSVRHFLAGPAANLPRPLSAALRDLMCRPYLPNGRSGGVPGRPGGVSGRRKPESHAPTVSSVASPVAADGHMAPDLDVDFGSRADLFHGEFVKIAQRAAKDRAH